MHPSRGFLFVLGNYKNTVNWKIVGMSAGGITTSGWMNIEPDLDLQHTVQGKSRKKNMADVHIMTNKDSTQEYYAISL